MTNRTCALIKILASFLKFKYALLTHLVLVLSEEFMSVWLM